jgi:hypothetical protein
VFLIVNKAQFMAARREWSPGQINIRGVTSIFDMERKSAGIRLSLSSAHIVAPRQMDDIKFPQLTDSICFFSFGIDAKNATSRKSKIPNTIKITSRFFILV